MATILGIIGSPRKGGNTQVVVERILDGAKSEGATAETLFLDDMKIRECIGCHACWNGLDCTRKDDMNSLYERIAGADCFVFGTPVYWYGPTAIMKAFLDRFVYFNCPDNRGGVKGKPAILTVSYEEDNPETAQLTVELFEKSFGYLGMYLFRSVIVPGVTKIGEVKSKPEILEKAYMTSEEIIRGLLNDK